MLDTSVEYSLNTPFFSNSNILNQKIIELVKNNNMIGGNSSDTKINTSNYITLIIGIVIIIIGFVLLWFKNNLVETEAIVMNKSCDNTNIDECKINIKYTINSIQYSKIITINKSNIPNEQTIKIYYSQSDPNSIQLFNPNYSIIGIGSILVGIFIIIFSLFDNSSLSNNTSKSSFLINSKTNLYSNSTDSNGFKVIYSS